MRCLHNLLTHTNGNELRDIEPLMERVLVSSGFVESSDFLFSRLKRLICLFIKRRFFCSLDELSFCLSSLDEVILGGFGTVGGNFVVLEGDIGKVAEKKEIFSEVAEEGGVGEDLGELLLRYHIFLTRLNGDPHSIFYHRSSFRAKNQDAC